MFKFKKQLLVSGIRESLNGKLSSFQIKILKILGFKYIAYEHTHQNLNSQNMLNRNQTWTKFIFILLKKLSNNSYRGFKHHISFFLKLFKPTIR